MILSSRDGKATIQYTKLGSSFNFIDPTPAIQANVRSNLRWTGAVWGNSGGVSNYTLVWWIKGADVGGGVTAALGGFRGDEPSIWSFVPEIATLDGYGLMSHIINSVYGPTVGLIRVAMNKSFAANWIMVALRVIDGTAVDLFIDGKRIAVTLGVPLTGGVVSMGCPTKQIAPVAFSADWEAGFDYWPSVRFGAFMAFSRVLTQQEMYDLYASTMFGKGYAISRAGLEAYYLGRVDSTTAGDIQTLPAYVDQITARTVIPDLSGHARHANLYSGRATWEELLDATNADAVPGIFMPSEWYDGSIRYDGTNNYTKSRLTVNYSGSTFS